MDFKQYLNFITKDSIRISIEEFLFLWLVKVQNEGSQKEKSEIIPLADLYFAQNNFYGRDYYPVEEKKAMSWNLMIEKLVKQGYLIDARQDKGKISLKKMIVTDRFKTEIWFTDKEETCKRLYDFIVDNCGTHFRVGNSNDISYFLFNQRDPTINSMISLNNYFWVNICKEGDGHCIEKFFALLEKYLSRNDLCMKVSNLLINYHEGTFVDEVERMEETDTNTSKFRRL